MAWQVNVAHSELTSYRPGVADRDAQGSGTAVTTHNQTKVTYEISQIQRESTEVAGTRFPDCCVFVQKSRWKCVVSFESRRQHFLTVESKVLKMLNLLQKYFVTDDYFPPSGPCSEVNAHPSTEFLSEFAKYASVRYYVLWPWFLRQTQ